MQLGPYIRYHGLMNEYDTNDSPVSDARKPGEPITATSLLLSGMSRIAAQPTALEAQVALQVGEDVARPSGAAQDAQRQDPRPRAAGSGSPEPASLGGCGSAIDAPAATAGAHADATAAGELYGGPAYYRNAAYAQVDAAAGTGEAFIGRLPETDYVRGGSQAGGKHVSDKPAKPGVFQSLAGFLIMLAFVVAAAWALRTFVFSPYEIPSGSMESTIMVSDKVFAEKISYYLHEVQPGDIVTFADPEVAGRTLIKRCVATGGQTIDLVDGMVYIDGQLQDEPYTQGKPTTPLTTAFDVNISYPYTIPDGYIWVMGDNRTNSADSRYFGPVPARNVTGRAVVVCWPLDRIGTLQ